MPGLTPTARNLLVLVIGEVSARFAALAGTAYLARTLGADGFGIVVFAATVVTYFSFAVQFGLDQSGSREVARNRNARAAYIFGLVGLRGGLALLCYAVLALLVLTVPLAHALRGVLLLQGLTLLVLAAHLGWAFQGLQRMGALALATLLAQLAFVASAVLLVRGPQDLVWAPLCYMAAEVTATVTLLVQYVARFGRPVLALDLATWRRSLGEGLPFFTSRLLRTIGMTFDILALKWYLSDAAVGLYSAASRIAFFLLGVLALYFITLNPILARAAARDRASVGPLVVRSLRLTAIAVIPMGVGGAILAPEIVTTVFGVEYGPAAAPLRLLIMAVAITMLGSNYRSGLVASDHQLVETRIIAASALLSVVLNLLLIPALGLVGAAGAFLASQALLLGLGYHAFRRHVLAETLLRHLSRPVAASLVMTLVVAATPRTPVLLPVVTGIVTYVATILALRATTVAELLDIVVARRNSPSRGTEVD